VCAAEIGHYLRQDHGGRVEAVDIHAPEFDAAAYHISRERFSYELHVIDRSGTVYCGVSAFWAIWRAFPENPWYRLLATVIMLPVVNFVARLFYRGFARIRPLLPKRHGCDSGVCKNR
jgi:predicted DCC family thiol-disulfide oxidoreductase YuxK